MYLGLGLYLSFVLINNTKRRFQLAQLIKFFMVV